MDIDDLLAPYRGFKPDDPPPAERVADRGARVELPSPEEWDRYDFEQVTA